MQNAVGLSSLPRVRVMLATHEPDSTDLAPQRRALAELAPRYEPVDDPARADAILFLGSGRNKFRTWRRSLSADSMLAEHALKCFVQDFTARPVPFLPGLYVNLPARRHDHRTRPVDNWTAIEPDERRRLLARTARPSLLFSFRGFASHPVRAGILDLDTRGATASITETTRWWDYGPADRDDDRRAYLEEIRDSAFVLCPRGIGTGSVRVYETMQLGRVPVIVSDEWAPPEGAPWPDFSIRVAESRVHDLPEIVERHRPDAVELGAAALAAWERWMTPGPVLLRRWLRAIEEIVEMRPADWSESAYHDRWRSQTFLWRNNIHPVQGAVARSSVLFPRVRSAARPSRTRAASGSEDSAEARV
jgi:hypothetical protein